jgi:hypothetical protein
MAVFQKFGQERLLPGIDAQVKEAWRIFELFAKWATDRNAIQQSMLQHQQQSEQALQMGQPPPPPISPLMMKPWYNPQIFRSEAVKWCVSDVGRDTFSKNSGAEQFMIMFLGSIDQQLMMAQMQAMGGPQPGAPGSPMANSNRNAAGAGSSSSGAAGTSQNNVEANASRSMAGKGTPSHG